jgi:hypothetical protein
MLHSPLAMFQGVPLCCKLLYLSLARRSFQLLHPCAGFSLEAMEQLLRENGELAAAAAAAGEAAWGRSKILWRLSKGTCSKAC